ncbi:aminoglycoside phosphotransferase family protein [Chaetoceros tenuissimus]|uniref:Aminoglycoside phosphotransferase family protein n=1 Tax=Chaetoceros tenuissimus TaxID=426638 RepID=A0AAD3D2C7_9STRA|nr:aminoglycoside phosphotransferase family protein [Chaetoceros tenuissimus]
MSQTDELTAILKAYFNDIEETYNVQTLNGGLINDTYLIQFQSSSSTASSYILQRINSNVFQNVKQLMSNITQVSRYISSLDSTPEFYLQVISTRDDSSYHVQKEKEATYYWRVYNYIPNSISYSFCQDFSRDVSAQKNLLMQAGKAYGEFQVLLHTFDVSKLYDTIPDFHHTSKRLQTFRDTVQKDVCDRVQNVQKEIKVVESFAHLAPSIINLLESGEIPTRVCHNDTKLENVLFDKSTHEAKCVIDYDTIMKGSLLYDFGDSIRSMANSASEEEQDLSLVKFDIDAFRCFAKGYISTAGHIMTQSEKEHLYLGPLVIVYEQGMRFLTDYIEGDVYFKTQYEDQNLCRARNQLRLLQDMFDQIKEVKSILSHEFDEK